MVSRSFIAWALLYLGHLERALAEAEQALTEARELGQGHSLAFGLHANCLFHQVRGNRALVEERSSALVALAEERGYPHLHATGTFFHGWARAASGKRDEGIAEMHRGLAAKQAGGAQIKVPYYLGVLAAAYARARRPVEALPLLTDAFERVEETGERWFEAELHRRKGEVVLCLSDADKAEAERCFRKAMAVAQAQGAKLWELRAATSLARLWRDQGRRAEAHDLLAPVYDWFTEGFDTTDLKDAKSAARGAAVSQVGNVRAWLEANGFTRFADTFEENEIDGEALLELTEEHLKDFGIALGPRLKLLKAIQSLRREADEKLRAGVGMAKPKTRRFPGCRRRNAVT